MVKKFEQFNSDLWSEFDALGFDPKERLKAIYDQIEKLEIKFKQEFETHLQQNISDFPVGNHIQMYLTAGLDPHLKKADFSSLTLEIRDKEHHDMKMTISLSKRWKIRGEGTLILEIYNLPKLKQEIGAQIDPDIHFIEAGTYIAKNWKNFTQAIQQTLDQLIELEAQSNEIEKTLR